MGARRARFMQRIASSTTPWRIASVPDSLQEAQSPRHPLVRDGLEEPRLPAPEKRTAGVRWHDMPVIPPVLVVRMRQTK
jgi:hypothetical protein